MNKYGNINCKDQMWEKRAMIIEVSENVNLTLEEIKWLESVCRKQRKRLKLNSGSNKCDKTLDMFEIDNLGESDE